MHLQTDPAAMMHLNDWQIKLHLWITLGNNEKEKSIQTLKYLNYWEKNKSENTVLGTPKRDVFYFRMEKKQQSSSLLQRHSIELKFLLPLF